MEGKVGSVAILGFLAALGLAGCTTPAPSVVEVAGFPDGRAEVVVALIDSGINPWHDAFRFRSGENTKPPFPAETVSATFRESIEAKGLQAWLGLEREKLYWFEGTRVLAISKTQETVVAPPDKYPIYDERRHGTATASVVAALSPHAWILMVETTALDWNAYQWLAGLAWVDIISSSIGNLGHVPNNLTGERDAGAAAALAAVQSGKLFVHSGGNEPFPNTFDESGPPWVISVGGAEGDQHGVTSLTSQPVDVVANFTWPALASNAGGNETFAAQGTSFGAPAVAGVLAEALHRLRAENKHDGGITEGAFVRTKNLTLTNHDLRRALNLTAAYWNTTDYRPSPDLSLQYNPAGTITNPATPKVDGTPVGPWVQMGWGFVDARQVELIVGLLEGHLEVPGKPEATAYMERLSEVRAALWDVRQR